MKHPFPKESVDLIFAQNKRNEIIYDKRKFSLYLNGLLLLRTFENNDLYEFANKLASGNYSPWPHEMQRDDIFGYNCTTVIPEVYLTLQAKGVKDIQIVQFRGFRDIVEEEDKKNGRNDSHFALILDIDRAHPYLFDPFFKIYGPIREFGKSFLKIGKAKNCEKRIREYEELYYWSAEDFSEMMNRMHEPGASLEVLAAGQQVYKTREIGKNLVTVRVYYDLYKNILKTRFIVPQVALSDKAIDHSMCLDEKGNAISSLLDLYYIENFTWERLLGSRRIASLEFATAEEIQKTLKKRVNLEKQDRIWSLWKDLESGQQNTLLRLAENMESRLGDEEYAKIYPAVLARTIYDGKQPDTLFLFPKEKRDERLLRLLDEVRERFYEMLPLNDRVQDHKLKLRHLQRNELKGLQGEIKKITKSRNKTYAEYAPLNGLRYLNKQAYDRTMDKFVLSEELKALSVSDLETIVQDLCLDKRIGYLAMVGDFVPLILKGKKELTLELFMGPIREKVRARFA